jgi:hypothetical protein
LAVPMLRLRRGLLLAAFIICNSVFYREQSNFMSNRI